LKVGHYLIEVVTKNIFNPQCIVYCMMYIQMYMYSQSELVCVCVCVCVFCGQRFTCLYSLIMVDNMKPRVECLILSVMACLVSGLDIMQQYWINL